MVLGVFAVAALVTWASVRRLLSPVDQLVVAAGAIGEGDFTVRVPAKGADELVKLSGAFNDMASSIEVEDSRRKQFTSDVAHELRTPLANVRGYLEAAQDGVAPIDRELVDSLHDDALLLQHLVDDLQVLTLAEAGQLRIRPEPVALAELVESVRQAHQQNAADSGVVLTTAGLPEVDVAVDPHRLRQVLGNLVSNAIRHTPAGGEVRITSDSAETMLRIHVSDNGEGIAPEHQARLFERFYRVDTSRTRATGGTGLGLAIAKELVEAHDGTLSVESELGRGSVFTVALPK